MGGCEHVGGQVDGWAGGSTGRWTDNRTLFVFQERGGGIGLGGVGEVGAEVGEGR